MAASPGPQPWGWQSTLLGRVVIVCSFLFLNLSLNVLNKWFMSKYGFGFPLFLSSCHMAFCAAALLPVMLLPSYRAQHRPTIERSWGPLLGLGVLFAANVGANNASLLTLSLSLNQMIRSTIPVITCLASFLSEGRPPAKSELGALLMLVTGVSIAVYDELSKRSASLGGVVLCLVATMCNGFAANFSGRILTEKMDALRLTFYVSSVACVALLPFHLKLEGKAMAAYRGQAQSSYLGLVLLTAALALAYNLSHAALVNVTSPTATTVMGELKIVLILLLSAVVLGEGALWTSKFVAGCTLAVLGFCLYSHERLRAARLSSVPVIKGVPELTPLLRPGGGSATAIAIGLSSGLRITEKASADALGRRPSGPAAGGAAL